MRLCVLFCERLFFTDAVTENGKGGALRISRFESLRQRIMPFAEARGLLTDEDVFDLVS